MTVRPRRRLERLERAEAEQADRPPAKEDQPPLSVPNSAGPLAPAVLAVQRHAGNAAAGALIARAPLQRDDAAAPAEATPANEGDQAKGSTYTMTMSELGSFPLISFSLGTQTTAPAGPGSGSGKEREDKGKTKEREGDEGPRGGDLNVSRAPDKLTPKLMEYAAKGKPIASAEIVLTKGGKVYLTIRLKNVFITSFQTGGGHGGSVETLGLSAESIEHEFAEQAGE